MDKTLREIPVKVYYLKMRENPNFNIDKLNFPNSTIQKLPNPITTEDYLFYYRTVGQAYYWTDRLSIKKTNLFSIINSLKTDIFIYIVSDKIAGFAEFVREKEYTEILYFGLFPDFIGKGLSKYFIKLVIDEAWKTDPLWIQLNTCELDHPNALSTYLKSGFVLDQIKIVNKMIT